MDGQVRVMLWCVPRSCSNAFTKAISQLENLKMILEPFGDSYYLGTERVSSRFGHLPAMPLREFTVVRESLEGEFKEYSTVFAKDMASYIGHQLGRWRDILPKGYHHTFLIRDPVKTVSSFYKIAVDREVDWDYFDPDDAEFQSIHDLFFLLKKETGKTPVLVDADDLLRNPAAILELFCTKTGMTFSQSMLSWKKGGLQEMEEKYPGWQSTLLPSTNFLPPSSSVTSGIGEIPEEVKQCIDDNMDYYKKLYPYRISC